MFCVSCGAAVVDGASVCTKCEQPVSAREASPASEGGGDAFRKVRKMNMVGAVVIAALFGALLGSKGGSMPPLLFGVVVFFFFLTVGAPAATALALSNVGGRLLRWIAIGLNIALILVWAVSMVQSFMHPSAQMIFNFGAALLYVWPEVINIRTLRAYGSAQTA